MVTMWKRNCTQFNRIHLIIRLFHFTCKQQQRQQQCFGIIIFNRKESYFAMWLIYCLTHSMNKLKREKMETASRFTRTQFNVYTLTHCHTYTYTLCRFLIHKPQICKNENEIRLRAPKTPRILIHNGWSPRQRTHIDIIVHPTNTHHNTHKNTHTHTHITAFTQSFCTQNNVFGLGMYLIPSFIIRLLRTLIRFRLIWRYRGPYAYRLDLLCATGFISLITSIVFLLDLIFTIRAGNRGEFDEH